MRRALLLVLALGLLPVTAAAQPSWFHPILVGELDYRVYSDEVEGEQGFALGRLRMGIDAQPTSWFQAVGSVEWALEKPSVVDAFIVFSPLDSLHLQLGYGRTPLFISARDIYIEALPIPELSLPVRAMWPGRDLGLEAWWTPRQLPLEAWVRLGNGSGSPLGNDNTEPSLDVRVDGVLGGAARGADPQPDWGLRVGVGAHAENAFDRAGIGGTTAAGFLFYRPVPVSGERWVSEAHALFWKGPLRLLAEGSLARESRSRDTDGNPQTPREPLHAIRAQGASLEASWLFHGTRYQGRDWPVSPPAEGGGWGGGAVEVTARAEWLQVGLGAPDVPPGGARGGTVSVRWWATSFLALSTTGYYLRYDAPPLESPDRRDSWLVLTRATVSLR